MGLIDWITSFWGDRSSVKLNDAGQSLLVDYHYKKLAVQTCTNLIANTLVRCEFQTYEKGKEKHGENYYLLNVSPNQNQNASEFFHQLVTNLVMKNECLAIMQNDRLYIVDDFEAEKSVLNENRYKNVKVGGFTFTQKIFKESEVLHFQLNDQNIMDVVNGLYNSYGKLLSSSMNIYKRSNAKRIVLKGDFLRPQTDEEQALINDMFDRQLQSWFEADKAGAVFQLQKGYEIDDLSGNGKGGSPTTTSRDIRALADDIFDFVAMAFNVPRGLLKGDVADVEKQTNNFLMFSILPIAELITDEFNRKMYTKEEYLKRTYTKLDTTRIKVIDVVQLATACDKFFAIGVNSVNDNLRLLGRERIDEEWADQRFVTKNYESVENIEDLKGGETNGDSKNQ
jgi:HK97 family phage portal protein